jgi:polysaccharide pyruvyl transferase WcaK-like protein
MCHVRLRAVVLNDTSLTENHLGCDCVAASIKTALRSRGIDLVHRVPLRADWRAPEHVNQVRSADLVIVNGEGSTHSSRDWVKDLLRVADTCRSAGAAAFLINAVYQNNDEETHELMRRFDYVSVRESASLAELRKVSVHARLVPDLSFFSLRVARNMPSTAEAAHRGIQLFSDSVIPEVTNELRHRFGERNDFAEAFISKPIPSRLRHLLHRLSRSMLPNRPRKFFCFRTPAEAQHALSRCRLLVTGRFHFVCFAIASGCPFFAVKSNTHKIEGMLADAGLSHRLLEPDQLADFPRKLPGWTPDDTERSVGFALGAQRAIAEMFDTIRQVASRPRGPAASPAATRGD